MNDHWRVFIGVLLPHPTRTALVAVQHELRGHDLAVRWTKAENLHITLHFLGDVALDAVTVLHEYLAAHLPKHYAPTLTCNTLGAFPNQRQPRVLWAGTGVDGTLQRLHTVAVAAGQIVGVPTEKRPYHPHITLGYVRDYATPPQRAACGAALQNTIWNGDIARPYPTIALIRSILGRDGATYAVLSCYELGGG